MKSLEAVQKIFKVLHILAIIAMICTAIGAIGSLLGGMAMLFVETLDENFLSMIISDTGAQIPENIGIGLIATSIFLAGKFVAIYFTCQYFKKELADGTPFTYDGARLLKKTGIINLAVPFGALFVATAITAIAKVDKSFSFEYDLLSGVFMILLSFVFTYGADLRGRNQEKDS